MEPKSIRAIECSERMAFKKWVAEVPGKTRFIGAGKQATELAQTV